MLVDIAFSTAFGGIVVAQLAIAALVLVTARWVHANAGMSSGYWVVAWIVIDLVLVFFHPLWVQVADHLVPKGGVMFELDSELETVMYLAQFLGALSRLALCSLVLAEVIQVVLIRKSPIGDVSKLVGWIARLQAHRHALGALAIAFLLLGVLVDYFAVLILPSLRRP